MKWKNELAAAFGERCLFDEQLSRHTTYRIGGKADALVLPRDRGELAFILQLAGREQLPLSVLGLGSNVLAADAGVRGIVAATKLMDGVSVSSNEVCAQCGAPLDKVVECSIASGLGGLEKLSGIPGSAGGAARMNAGAFGQETFDALESVDVMNSSGGTRTIPKSEIPHGYRRVEGLAGLIILSAKWRLSPASATSLKKTRLEILSKRASSQPLELPSAGSVFKRPEGGYASALIEAAGLKGLRSGDAQISAKHAGFIVNVGSATAKDVIALANRAKAEVREKFGIELELEQIFLGEF